MAGAHYGRVFCFVSCLNVIGQCRRHSKVSLCPHFAFHFPNFPSTCIKQPPPKRQSKLQRRAFRRGAVVPLSFFIDTVKPELSSQAVRINHLPLSLLQFFSNSLLSRLLLCCSHSNQAKTCMSAPALTKSAPQSDS